MQNTLRLNGEEISASDRCLGKQLFPKASRHKTLEFAPESSSVVLAPAKPKEKEPLVLLGKQPMGRLGACSTTSLVVGDIFSTANDIERKAAVRRVRAWTKWLVMAFGFRF